MAEAFSYGERTMSDENTRRRSDKWRDRLLDFALGALLSFAVSAITIYPRMTAVETRLASVEKKLDQITVVKVKGNSTAQQDSGQDR